MDILHLLDSILGSHVKYNHNEYYFSCPFCHHKNPKLAVNLTKGAWHCWVCNTSGKKLWSLLKKLDCSKEQLHQLNTLQNEQTQYPISVEEQSTTLHLPPEYKPLWKYSKTLSYKHALSYVLSRGLTASDILRYQLGYCEDGIYKNRIIIPSYNRAGVLNYFVGRTIYDDMSYKNPPISKNIIGFEFHINWSYPIVLCEGVFDAMAIKRNAIPLLGKTISKELYKTIITENVQHIYLMLDLDALAQTSKFAEQFMKDGRTVYVVQLKDKDPSNMGFVECQRSIQLAKPLTFIDLIKLRVNT